MELYVGIEMSYFGFHYRCMLYADTITGWIVLKRHIRCIARC